jgi:hypothetical protein
VTSPSAVLYTLEPPCCRSRGSLRSLRYSLHVVLPLQRSAVGQPPHLIVHMFLLLLWRFAPTTTLLFLHASMANAALDRNICLSQPQAGQHRWALQTWTQLNCTHPAAPLPPAVRGRVAGGGCAEGHQPAVLARPHAERGVRCQQGRRRVRVVPCVKLDGHIPLHAAPGPQLHVSTVYWCGSAVTKYTP